MLNVIDSLNTAPPETLTIGGTLQQASDGTSPIGAIFRAYSAAVSTGQTTGAVGNAHPGIRTVDIGLKSSIIGVILIL